MRKLFFRTTTIVSIIMLMVLACHKERLKETTTENDEDATSMSVADAKIFYDANKQPDMVLKAGKV